MNEIFAVLPEATLTALACLVLIVDVTSGSRSQATTFWVAVLAVLVVLVEIALLFPQHTVNAFNNTFRLDAMSAVLKVFLLTIVLLAFFYAREYFMRRGRLVSEFFILGLFAAIGMMVLISAHNLLTVYLGLELLSLSLYAMVAMDRDSITASEAAMKYFVLGALASGMLLYGMSMIYGVAGSLDLSLIAEKTFAASDDLLFTFGLVFVLIGIAFKLGVAPFHMWVPDVYQGAPTPVTLFIGSAPKLAAFAMAIRLLTDGLGGLSAHWQPMLILLAVTTMALGNIVAIAQTNLKRMLAYSTIAHMGFLLLGIIAANAIGYAASMFYVIVYALMSMGAFGAIIVLGVCHERIGSITRLRWSLQTQPMGGVPHDGIDVLTGRCAAFCRLLGQVVRAQRSRSGRLLVACRRGRVLFSDRCLLLSARGQTHVFRRT